MKKVKLLSIPLFLIVLATGCKKEYLETRPSTGVLEQDIFSSTAKISSALEGIYKHLFAFAPNGSTRHDNFGQKGWDLSSDLMGNDMVVHTQGYGWFNASYQYTEWLSPLNGRHSANAWFFYNSIVKQSNMILANIDGAQGTAAEKELIKGEALGLRAYAYFYLANYWQHTYKGNENAPGVPVYTTSSVQGKGRGKLSDVYAQIEADLAAAAPLLTGKPRANKNRVDISVVRGFQARVALLKEEWAAAATAANQARTGYTLMTPSQYQEGFSKMSNPEFMWGSTIPAAEATIYASFYSHIDITNNGYAGLGGQKKITKDLYDQIPTGDVRKTVFRAPGTGTSANPDYNQLKFRVPIAGSWEADYLYMRAAEMYLIEAEALARAGNDATARTVLQTLVQSRYPAYSAAGLSGTALLNEIMLQRRIELWGEGHSLIDIKRWKTGLNRPTGAGNHGAPNFNPAIYTTAPADGRMLMRIPQSELDSNSEMTPADQNPF